MSLYDAVIMLLIVAAIVMIVVVRENIHLPSKARLCFSIVFATTLVCALCEWIGIRLDSSDLLWNGLHLFVKTLELSGTPFIAYAMIRVLENKKAARISLVICIINTLLEYWSAATGMIFYIDEAGVYHHGSFYWIYTVSYLVSILLYTVSCFFFSLQYQNRGRVSLFSIIFFLIYGTLIHNFHPDVQISYLCLSLSEIMLYIYYIGLTEQMDSLTRLLDRKSYDIQCAALDKKTTILMFDIDRFKQINDTRGHQTGDVCLAYVGSALKHCYGKYGLCYRIGGDEFCVLLTKKIPMDIKTVNEEFARLVASEELIPGHRLTVSFGSAEYNPYLEPYIAASRRADERMYENKKVHYQQESKL